MKIARIQKVSVPVIRMHETVAVVSARINEIHKVKTDISISAQQMIFLMLPVK